MYSSGYDELMTRINNSSEPYGVYDLASLWGWIMDDWDQYSFALEESVVSGCILILIPNIIINVIKREKTKRKIK